MHPADNNDVADAAARYRDFLTDDAGFATMTIEALLDSGALRRRTAAALRTRYLPP